MRLNVLKWHTEGTNDTERGAEPKETRIFRASSAVECRSAFQTADSTESRFIICRRWTRVC